MTATCVLKMVSTGLTAAYAFKAHHCDSVSYLCLLIRCRLPHVSSSVNLSPATSTSLSRFSSFSSSDFHMSPRVQLTSPLASGLSSNSSNTNQGFASLGSFSQPMAMSHAYPSSPASAAAQSYGGPNPMVGRELLPQNPSLAVHLGQIRTEKQKTRASPLDFMEGMWGFDEFPPVPGMSHLIMCLLGLLLLCQKRFLARSCTV